MEQRAVNKLYVKFKKTATETFEMLKNAVFWDVMPCGFCMNVGSYKSHMA
jgi:hypothetical protein